MWLVLSDGANGEARSAPSSDNARVARIARTASGASTVAIRRRRPPQRGQASTSMSNARLISSAHAQWREGGAAGGASFASADALAAAGA